jgi:hypothetical protein
LGVEARDGSIDCPNAVTAKLDATVVVVTAVYVGHRRFNR